MTKIKVQKVYEDSIIPSYAHETDSGMDLYSIEEFLIPPGHRALIPTGIRVAIPKGYEIQIRPKSGLALKQGITVLNSPGTIDSDYRGEIKVILINHSSTSQKIFKNQKIAQMVLNKVENMKLSEEKLNKTKRGSGGFGSTGLR